MDEANAGQVPEDAAAKDATAANNSTATMDASAATAAASEPTTQPISARDLLLEIELESTLQFGSREMPLKDVLALGPGDVLELNRHVSEPVDLVVGDRIMARGEVVIVSGNFALLITEVAAPQLRLESIRSLF
jgi:flagellar motor switch protein FliN/FliY